MMSYGGGLFAGNSHTVPASELGGSPSNSCCREESGKGRRGEEGGGLKEKTVLINGLLL